jgi:hypothetical protein
VNERPGQFPGDPVPPRGKSPLRFGRTHAAWSSPPGIPEEEVRR